MPCLLILEANPMSHKRSLYLVPKALDSQIRVFGLPMDEFIPSLFFFIFFFFLDKVVLSVAIPVLTVVIIKVMKQGQGSAWLMHLCYWHLPKGMMMHILRKTPPSEQREYIA